MEFFENCETVQEIKKLYHELVKVHHPDVGGDTEIMKRINAEYQSALNGCHGQKSVDLEGVEHTYIYDPEIEDEIAQKLIQLLGLQIKDLDIFLIGVWIWIKGDTKPYKETLKNLNCHWHQKNLAWYYRPESFKCWRSSGKSLTSIAITYGCQKITDVKEKEAVKKLAYVGEK